MFQGLRVWGLGFWALQTFRLRSHRCGGLELGGTPMEMLIGGWGSGFRVWGGSGLHIILVPAAVRACCETGTQRVQGPK